MDTWLEEQVEEFLVSLNMNEYLHVFKGVTGEELCSLGHDALKTLNITCVGHRLLILNNVYKKKKELHMRFQEGDYIPYHEYPLPSQVDQNLEKMEIIKKLIQEKDLQIINLKEKIEKEKKQKLRLNTINTKKDKRDELSIRVYGNQLPGRQNESYKTFRIGPHDDCIHIILETIQKYKLSGDWKEYVFLLVVKDQDRLIDVIHGNCHDDSSPNFIIQHTRHVNGPSTKPLNMDPGTFLAASLSPNVVSTAVGIYDYEAQSREELDVKVGSRFSILARDGQWCVVEKGGKRGSVPTITIFELENADSTHANQAVLCVHDYSRKSRHELSLQKGDRLKLVERYHHWYLVERFGQNRDSDENVGLVPFNHITMVESPIEKVMVFLSQDFRDHSGRSTIERSSHSKQSSEGYNRDEWRQDDRSRFNGEDRLRSTSDETLRSRQRVMSPQKSPNGSKVPFPTIDDSTTVEYEGNKHSVEELERHVKQWESLLNERDNDLNGSIKTIKDTKKLIQYVFSSTSPIKHVISKRPLSGIVSFILDEICKKNSSRWIQYANAKINGSDRKELDSLLFSSIRKNYLSLMKIVNLVLEDGQVAPLVKK